MIESTVTRVPDTLFAHSEIIGTVALTLISTAAVLSTVEVSSFWQANAANKRNIEIKINNFLDIF